MVNGNKDEANNVTKSADNVKPAPITDGSKTLNDEVAKLRAELEAERQKNRYNPQKIEMPQEQRGLPKNMQDAQTRTVVRDMSTLIKEKMMQLEDMATMEVFLDTRVRMENRLDSIKKLGSANNMKIRGQWKTVSPKLHITKLEAKKMSNDEYQISFGVFETDEKGEKKLFVQYADVTLHDGSKINRPTSAEYRVAYEVIETIKTGKPITREVIRLDRNEE